MILAVFVCTILDGQFVCQSALAPTVFESEIGCMAARRYAAQQAVDTQTSPSARAWAFCYAVPKGAE